MSPWQSSCPWIVQTRQAESPRGVSQLVVLQPQEALHSNLSTVCCRHELFSSQGGVSWGCRACPPPPANNRQRGTFGSSALSAITGSKCSLSKRVQASFGRYRADRSSPQLVPGLNKEGPGRVTDIQTVCPSQGLKILQAAKGSPKSTQPQVSIHVDRDPQQSHFIPWRDITNVTCLRPSSGPGGGAGRWHREEGDTVLLTRASAWDQWVCLRRGKAFPLNGTHSQ